MKTVVGEKGQVTIPKALRESLGLTPGTTLEIHEEAGALVARKRAEGDPFTRLVGILPQIQTDEALRALRGPDFDPAIDGRKRDNSR